MTKDYTGKRVILLKPIMTEAKNLDGTPAGIRTFGKGVQCTCIKHFRNTGNQWEDGYMGFETNTHTFGGYMENAVREVK